ncbi:hypothetical protein N476_15065 [Pseudoalteromonas luteoviolacea H33]|uniref:Uncharacterized protein n=1 Tax=Pseudoalteromonas luteoviolacea H33 TaxID=1365251 RepID=A0A167EJ08_9GAMM|nr:hypothetical protein N476_15065 [Pseudoalteromonas luteoviolacea H33]KZN74841.1 hypothetical protein N477_21260 [Pseudoalteromonas luteoviolacea H33-S]
MKTQNLIGVINIDAVKNRLEEVTVSFLYELNSPTWLDFPF